MDDTRLADGVDRAHQAAEVGPLQRSVEQALLPELGQPLKMRILLGILATLQQLLQQTAEGSGFESLQCPAFVIERVMEGSRAEIAEQRSARGIDEQVVAIEIAMKNAAGVKVLHDAGDAGSDLQHPLGIESLLRRVAIASATGERWRAGQHPEGWID